MDKITSPITTIQRLFYHLAFSFIILGMILILYIYYLFFWPVEPLKILNNPVPILNRTIHTGDTLIYRVKLCKYINIKGTVTRAIVDHYDVFLPDTTSEFPVGCRTANITLLIPEKLASGIYRIISTFKYQVNPLHEVDVTFETKNFTIVE